MTGNQRTRVSRRTFLASIGAGIGALGTLPVVHQGSADSSPLIVGHRGVAGLEPPNTIVGVRRAEELGADGVGLDVRQTADGELVLFHDPILDLTTNASGRVEDQTLEELQDVRVEGEPLPTLREALEVVAPTDQLLFLELKGECDPGPVLELIEEYGLVSRTILTAFDAAALTDIETGAVRRGLLGKVPNPDLFDSAAAMDSAFAITHYVPYGLEWFVEEANRHGIRPGVWELESTELHIEDALSFDIDVLTTNRPDIALEKIDR